MRAKRMIFFTRFLVGFAGLFWRGKQTQSNGFVIDFYFRKPFLAFNSNTRIAAFVIAAFLAVMRVFNVGSITQIANAIVRSISVYVVNLMRRPATCRMQPSQTMREIQHVIQPNDIIPAFHAAPRPRPLSAATPFDAPSKFTCGGVVIKQIVKTVYRKFIFHGTVNINNWRECQV